MKASKQGHSFDVLPKPVHPAVLLGMASSLLGDLSQSISDNSERAVCRTRVALWLDSGYTKASETPSPPLVVNTDQTGICALPYSLYRVSIVADLVAPLPSQPLRPASPGAKIHSRL
jgi:hypothetical protein